MSLIGLIAHRMSERPDQQAWQALSELTGLPIDVCVRRIDELCPVRPNPVEFHPKTFEEALQFPAQLLPGCRLVVGSKGLHRSHLFIHSFHAASRIITVKLYDTDTGSILSYSDMYNTGVQLHSVSKSPWNGVQVCLGGYRVLLLHWRDTIYKAMGLAQPKTPMPKRKSLAVDMGHSG